METFSKVTHVDGKRVGLVWPYKVSWYPTVHSKYKIINGDVVYWNCL
jgi:hypothetical protein